MIAEAKTRLAAGQFSTQDLQEIASGSSTTGFYSWAEIAAAAEMLREIQPKDMVLMEVARGWVETVQVDEIIDGTVYGTDDEGESFCAPLACCDKVPC